jgi:hypothetical protein
MGQAFQALRLPTAQGTSPREIRAFVPMPKLEIATRQDAASLGLVTGSNYWPARNNGDPPIGDE